MTPPAPRHASALLFFCWAARATPPQVHPLVDPGWELFVTNSEPLKQAQPSCYPAPSLPSFARGSYFVGGPAVFEMDGYKFQSLFDGFGQINRFDLGKGQICYTAAMMNTGMYDLALKQGPIRGVLFEDTVPARPPCPPLQPMCNLLTPNDNNWVNILPMGDGQAALLSDTHEMVQMDMDTLDCQGLRHWGDDAHGVLGELRPTPDWVEKLHMPTKYPRGAHSSPGQKRHLLARVPTETYQYFHSYGVTPNYVVLPFNLEMPMPKLSGTPVLLDSFRASWKGVHVVDLDGYVQVFQTDPFFHAHIINSFENETGIVLDTGSYKTIPFSKGPALDRAEFLDKATRDGATNRPAVRRLHLHLAGPSKGLVTVEDLIPYGTRARDFFKINMARSGLPYCVYYATEWWHDDVSYADMAILKHNICTGEKVYWNRAHTYPGEPFFIASGGSDVEDVRAVLVAMSASYPNRPREIMPEAQVFYAGGVPVEVLDEETLEWREGKAQSNSDGTFNIRYAPGDWEKYVSRSRLRGPGISLLVENGPRTVMAAATLPTYQRSRFYKGVQDNKLFNSGIGSPDWVIKRWFPNALRVQSEWIHRRHPCIVKQDWVWIPGESKKGEVRNLGLRMEKMVNILKAQDPSIRTLVFANTPDACLAAQMALKGQGIECAALHAGLAFGERLEGLKKFGRGDVSVLICSDIAARGIDLPTCRHVLQLEFARNTVDHLHRVGRAARAGRLSKTTNLYGAGDVAVREAVMKAPAMGLDGELLNRTGNRGRLRRTRKKQRRQEKAYGVVRKKARLARAHTS